RRGPSPGARACAGRCVWRRRCAGRRWRRSARRRGPAPAGRPAAPRAADSTRSPSPVPAGPPRALPPGPPGSASRARLLLEVRDSFLDARENAVHLEAGIVERLEPPRRTCLGVGAHELAVAGRRVAVARDLEPSPAADPPDLGGELLRRHHHALEPGAVRNP